ncbi:fumarylacetoacetate hydrolase family protein [Dactylosporangium sp. NPDC005572]|uniref:2-keto-4-pentenoate hydratase n=1 Tax=Dactylosporangium sp. NPDC005572 TaxID=3156889 RepID=UPI00339EF784
MALANLLDARATGRPCPPIRGLLPDGDVAAAYAVQAAWVEHEVAGGASVVGRKVGLTNPAVQAQLGVDQPDFGTLLSWMHLPQDTPIDASLLLQPRIEAEVAFLLGADLDAAGIGPAEVVAATAAVAPALEIVDSRIAGWDIGIVDTIADNASSGLFVLGDARVPLDGLDLRYRTMTMRRGGDVVSSGSGAACLGDPVLAVAWLANIARDLGRPLRAGEVVLSGALGPMVPVVAGDRFAADIDGLGRVSAVFR